MGTSDMYPHKYQDFSSANSANLTAIDALINEDGTDYTSF